LKILSRRFDAPFSHPSPLHVNHRPMPVVVVLGASSNPSKFGHRAVQAFLHAHWFVIPVNPRETLILGLPCKASMNDIPGPVDVVSAYLPPSVLIPLLPAIARMGCRELWLNPGTDTAEVLEAARSLGIHAVPCCSLVRLASGATLPG